MMNRNKENLLIAFGIVAGLLIGYVLTEYSCNNIGSIIWKVVTSVGITIVVLVPLMVWAIKTMLQHKEDIVTFQYISSQAKEWGFIGTLIGVIIMFAALGVSLESGDNGAIRKAISGFSQAATSTLVGLLISSFCKHCYYKALKQETTKKSL